MQPCEQIGLMPKHTSPVTSPTSRRQATGQSGLVYSRFATEPQGVIQYAGESRSLRQCICELWVRGVPAGTEGDLRPGPRTDKEVGCGSGGYALHIAQNVGCSIVGVDVNAPGVHNANQLASASGVAARAHFEQCDASKSLPFDDETFDAVFANDVLCHIPGRLNVLCEMFRVLKPGGRMLFSDALVVGGMISHEEINTRSSIGYYVYSPPGENERLSEHAGFREIRATDTTESAASIAKKWHQAREMRRDELVVLEGTSNFEGLQAFLSCVHCLTAERRLLRYLYVADRGR